MRRVVLLIAGLSATAASAQTVVSSPAPDRVAVTVYRDPNRGTQDLNLNWLGGFALVSETRRVRLPAGTSELRFEGVTGGIVPQSAIVSGLGDAVLEKNRDARLLSPGALLDAYLAQRVTLRRTSKATGAIRQQDAVIRATGEGVIVQTADGIEALRCTGVPETLIAPAVPADLSAKPTLSVRVSSPQPVETEVTLSYLTNNFDWQANYVAELSPDGRRMSLFAWLTMANGDETALAGAAAQAVAGKVHYQRVEVPAGEAKPISIQCWPQGTTSDIPEQIEQLSESIVVTGSRISYAPTAPPPPPPPPMPERGGDEVMAQEERLGDVRLYRIPISVTVAPKSQKQIALMRQAAVKVESILRVRLEQGHGEFDEPVQRLLRTRNRTAEGLGLAIPSGKVAVFGRQEGRRILLGEGRIDDYTVGQKVEIPIGQSPAVRARHATLDREKNEQSLTLTNDLPVAQTVEVDLGFAARPLSGARAPLKQDGRWLWRIAVPANGSSDIRYTY